jgi:hypothetical protein
MSPAHMSMRAHGMRTVLSPSLSSFSIVCWNACGLLTRSSDIILYLHDHQPAILIIIEPLVTHLSHPAFPKHYDYNVVSIKHAYGHRNGGLIVYMHRSITYQQHTAPRFSPTSATTAALFHIASPMLPRPFILIPVYMSCDAARDEWITFTSFLQGAPTFFASAHDMPVLVMGDMNAHDPLWDMSLGVADSDAAGKHLGDFLSQPDDWHILNLRLPVCVPTHHPSRPGARPSVIDLALCNDYNLVDSFAVLQDPALASDHSPIMTSLIVHPHANASQPQRYIWRTSRDDIPWDIFQHMLSDMLTPWRAKWTPHLSHERAVTQHDIDTCWHELRDIITHTALCTIGKKAVSIHHQHWFTLNPDIPTLHRKYVQLRRQRITYKRNDIPIPAHINRMYQQARHLFCTAMRDAKQACWHELVEQVCKDHKIVWTAWHRTVPATSRALPAFNRLDPAHDPPATTPVDNLNIMARHVQNISTIPRDASFNNAEDINVQQTVASLQLPSAPAFLPFTQQQLTDACHNVNTNTALGPDDISPHFLKHGGPMLMSCLFLMFHVCYQHGLLPSQWKQGIVVALYKHTGDKHDVSNYRPINVTSVVMRLFDRLMLPTLIQYMSRESIPSSYQFGFTRGRSTYDAIFRLLSFIGRYFQHPIPAIFIDISKAYDRVWVHGLIHKLHKLNMSPHDLHFYIALLSNRTFRVAGQGFMSDLFTSPDGVPQGGVSAPQLFTIYIHDLVDAISSIYIHINLFADDIAIWASEHLNGQSVLVHILHMQDALNKLSTWASTWKISFSASKSQMIIFYAYRSLPHAWTLFLPTLTGFIIAAVDTYKYLGLILHKRLRWDAHVKELIHKATPTSYQIARLASYHINNRPSFKVVRQLVMSVLVPKLVYAIPFIQFPFSMSHRMMRQMKRLVIYPLRRSLGLPNNAHHDSIFIESRVLPLQYMLVYHSILFARRYILQAATPHDQQQRHHDIFSSAPLITHIAPSHPLTNIAIRCQSIRHPLTATLAAFQRATSKQLWSMVFNRFYQQWYISQHPSNPHPEPHSLFPCYIHAPTCTDISIPQYLAQLHPLLSSVISRLRFNRARLNHSLYKRTRADTDICSTCENNTIETVEHVIMWCPRYDSIRFHCFCDLSSITGLPPLTSSFVFPFLLCCFPASIPKSMHARLITRIGIFLQQLQRMRDM